MSGGSVLYLDDIGIGDVLKAGPYKTTCEEMVEFARRWNPRQDYLSGEIACPEYVRAVKQRLVSELGIAESIIGAVGHDDISYPVPARPGDAITSQFEAIALHPSRSKPDRGVAKFRVTIANQRGETLLSYIDIIMMGRRPSQETSA